MRRPHDDNSRAPRGNHDLASLCSAPMQTPAQFDRRSDLRDDLPALEALLDDPHTRFLPLYRGQLPITESGVAPRPVVADATVGKAWLELGGELVFLGLHAGKALFAIDISAAEQPLSLPGFPSDTALGDLRRIAGNLPALWAQLAIYGRGLLHFHGSTRFCGPCGGQTRPRRGGHTRSCVRCNKEHFPRLEPAVLVLVHHQNRLLLARQPGFPGGMYSTLAGFVEPGESLEEAVAREVQEETGIAIAAPRYHASQPWPFPASLMIGFRAEALHDRIRLDETELEDARFFSRQELESPTIPGFFTPASFSLAGQLIGQFLSPTP